MKFIAIKNAFANLHNKSFFFIFTYDSLATRTPDSYSLVHLHNLGFKASILAGVQAMRSS